MKANDGVDWVIACDGDGEVWWKCPPYEEISRAYNFGGGEDGINKPFTKIYTVKVEGTSVFYRLLGFRNNGEVVLVMDDDNDTGYAVEVYEPSSGHISGIGMNGNSKFSAMSYMETLILLHESNSIIH
ncbi:hypothetical protein Tco_0890633 [Tanacetum coccineum]|uniref:Uncharacterized protein n=1 Tax=Tanacetum coccineum TaxID=301880 RepID=A0ABQ5C105_9ASTR